MSKKLTLSSLVLAASMLLSYVESLIPPLFSVPGIKLGLANIAVIFALCCLGIKYAAVISLSRVFLSALLFGNAISLIYALCGAFLSLIVMAVLKRFSRFSVPGISVAGGVCHNIGQIAAAIVVIDNTAVAYYLPALILSGVIAGAAIGLLSSLIIGRFEGLKLI